VTRGVCKRGHELTDANSMFFDAKIVVAGEVVLRQYRKCRACQKMRMHARWAVRHGRRAHERSVHCANGHPWTPETTRRFRQRKRLKTGEVRWYDVKSCRRCTRVTKRIGKRRRREREREAKGQWR
jgi:hypothetical protein